MLGRDEQMQSGFVAIQSFTHVFGFASKEAIFEAREFQKPNQMRFHQGCDTGMEKKSRMNFYAKNSQSYSVLKR